MIKSFFERVLLKMTDMRHWLIVIATFLFWFHRLSESGWITFVLTTAGIHATSEIVNIIKTAGGSSDGL